MDNISLNIVYGVVMYSTSLILMFRYNPVYPLIQQEIIMEFPTFVTN